MIEKIKELLKGVNDKIIPQRVNKAFFQKHGLLSYIENTFDDTYSFNEKIYCIFNGLTERPKCKTCGNSLIFATNRKYPIFCSKKCANNDPDVLIKNKLGVSKSLKNAYLERGDEIKQKRANTLEKNFGIKTISPFNIPEIQQKNKNTWMNLYGVSNPYQIQKCKDASLKTIRSKSISKYKLNGYDIEYLGFNTIKVKNFCQNHKDVILDIRTFYNRTSRNRNGIPCIICNPLGQFSSLEIQFEQLLKEIGIQSDTYIKNTRKIIKPGELDFFFPNENLAVELNGVYWHSEKYLNKDYHRNKTELCEKNGIQLIHIWEDDFYDKKEIVKSIIENKFNKTLYKIHARKCNIRDISSNDYRVFLKNNHIQGEMNSSIRYGLYYNDELVSVIGFGKLRSPLGCKNKEEEYELQRFCTKLHTNIVGAASKLFKHFERNIKYTKIISYAKRDYSNGNLYKQLGFKLEQICNPGYYWLINDVRKHRYNYRKDKICNEKNKHMTEIEIMHEAGYLRCYDSGNLKFSKIHINNT